MKPRPEGEYGFWDMHERPLSQENADSFVRLGTALMGLGMFLILPAMVLLIRLEYTSRNHKQLIVSAVVVFLVALAVTQYGGLKLGHGRHQGGKLGLQPRTQGRLWRVAEISTGGVAVIFTIGAVGLAVFGWFYPPAWVLLIVYAMTGWGMYLIWTHVRDRGQRLFPPDSSQDEQGLAG